MKRFAFRLESVLRIRTFELERARTQLVVIETERTRRAEVFRNEIEQLAKGQALLESEAREGADGQRIGLRADAVTAGRYRALRAERAIGDLNEPLAEARRRVHHARSRVRSLERLKENAEAEHRRAGLASEQAELEELAISRVALEGLTNRRQMEESAT